MTPEEFYRIAVEPVEGWVRVSVDGQTVAESTQVAVMHETNLPSHPYFPKADLVARLLEDSPYRTFCPFKGTAQHWHLRLPDGRLIENGAWSYERPLAEAEPIGQMVAFYPNLIDPLSSEHPLPTATSGRIPGSPLTDWLLTQAWLCTTPAELTQQFAERLCAMGMPVWRVNVSIWTLHPVLVGQRLTWQRETGTVEVGETAKGALQQPGYLNSPVRHVSEGRGGVRQRLDVDNPEFRFPVMEDLRARGGTDYVAMPLFFSDGQIQTLTLASDDPTGFTTAQLGQVFAAVTALSRFYEVLTLRRDSAVLFDTYLGERTRKQVLGGLTHRGDGEDIRAVILFCDLRDSTTLSGSMARETYLGLLNEFFESATAPVIARGGEVLKFIGDAVLAIFPLDGADDDERAAREACKQAYDAAREIIARVAAVPTGEHGAPLRCAIGIHLGEVMYGNVGAPERLDFTVIGTAANVAARLSAQCKTLEKPLLMSAAVAEHVPEGLESLGSQSLRHVREAVEVFAVAGR